MKVYDKNKNEINLTLDNEVCAKAYASSYMIGDVGMILFPEVFVYFGNKGIYPNYYLMFATTGNGEMWFGIVEWRHNLFYGARTPRVYPIIDSYKIEAMNNQGTIAFPNSHTFYQVTPIGI